MHFFNIPEPLLRSVARAALAGALAASAGIAARAQETAPDTLVQHALGDVVVTATRAARALEDVPVPTTVVTREDVQARGLLRLSDLLAEVPGLFVASEIGGEGLQVQGFDADYTLILVDGQPVVGRTAGTLDLERLAVTGVERVEVVRGPLSARYGSDALAGVVNLITRRPGRHTSARGMGRVESQGVTDLSVEAETGDERWGLRVFADRYGSDGHSLRPDLGTLAVPAFADYAAEARARFAPTGTTDLGLTARAATQQQEGAFLLGSALYDEAADRTDWSLNPTLRQRLSRHLSLEAALYGARFENRSVTAAREGGALLEETGFTHDYGKAEAGLTWAPSARHFLSVGGGLIGERVGGDRYAEDPAATQPYAYAEYAWQPVRLLDLVLAARYDAPSDYAARLTPSVAALVRPSERVRFRASVGSGYKAPNFRQRYLSFTNGAVGYSVFGAEEVQAELAALDAAGGLTRYLLDPSLLAALRAESSMAYGLGAEVEPVDGLVVKVNGFHNEVRDLIETQPVAVKTSGQQVFTYFNLDRIYTRGLEAEVSGPVVTSATLGALTVGLGYQYLDTADRDVLDQIDAGTLFRRDDAGRDVRVTRGDYGGLFGRSRHSGTLRLTHHHGGLGLTTAARVLWRGRYGFADVNANVTLDDPDEYAPGYALVHVTTTKTLGRAELQLGVRNLLDHTDPDHLPSETGRVFFVGAGYRF